MNFSTEIKDKVSVLLRHGQRQQAISFLQQELKISEVDAEKLVNALEQENLSEYVVKPLITKSVTAFTSGPGGCISLVLKGFMVFFGLITVTLYGFGIILYFYYNNIASEAVAVTGTVVEFQINSEGSSAPIVEYDWNGELKKYRSSMYSDPPDYALNDAVQILVNPENPDEILIDSFTERYLISLVLASVGTFFLVFTLGIYFVTRKIKRSFDKSE